MKNKESNDDYREYLSKVIIQSDKLHELLTKLDMTAIKGREKFNQLDDNVQMFISECGSDKKSELRSKMRKTLIKFDKLIDLTNDLKTKVEDIKYIF